MNAIELMPMVGWLAVWLVRLSVRLYSGNQLREEINASTELQLRRMICMQETLVAAAQEEAKRYVVRVLTAESKSLALTRSYAITIDRTAGEPFARSRLCCWTPKTRRQHRRDEPAADSVPAQSQGTDVMVVFVVRVERATHRDSLSLARWSRSEGVARRSTRARASPCSSCYARVDQEPDLVSLLQGTKHRGAIHDFCCCGGHQQQW